MCTVLRALAIACAFARAASAEVSAEDAARATALFQAGQVAMDAGRIEEGCSRFEQSLALDPQIGTRMNLADCREKQGRIIEAYQLYEYSAAEAEQTNKPGRLKFARERLDQLAQSLVRLTVRVVGEVAGETVTLTTVNGPRELPRAVWSRTVVVEPGPFSVEAKARDHKLVRLEREAAGGETIEVEVPALESTLPPPPPPPPPPKPSLRLPLAVAGVGVVLLAVGIGFGISAATSDDPADEDTADTHTVLAAGFGLAGVVGIGVGAYLYVKAKRSVAVVPSATSTTAGLTLLGRF
jgi:hypothetical protein